MDALRQEMSNVSVDLNFYDEFDKLEENEVDKYLENLQEILNFADVVNKAPVDGLEETIGENEKCNVFRKDEVKVFENHDGLLQHAPEQERGMFNIPKVM